MVADPAAGRQNAADDARFSGRQSRAALAKAWPAYAEQYYGRLRRLSMGTPLASGWRTFASALPVPAVVVSAQLPADQPIDTVITDDELDRLLAELEDR